MCMNSKNKLKIFIIPIIVFISLILFIYFKFKVDNENIAYIIAIFAIVVGSLTLIVETIRSIFQKVFALDYIALLAIGMTLFMGEYLVALVIVLMLSGGNALEEYATARAKKSLTSLIKRIPTEVLLHKNDESTQQVKIEEIKGILGRSKYGMKLRELTTIKDVSADGNTVIFYPTEMGIKTASGALSRAKAKK